MERPVETGSPEAKPPRRRSAHLMCGTPFWGVAAAIVCVYFAYSTFAQLREGDFYWQHEWWTEMTWMVWVLLLTGLLTDTRCWRERVFFGLLWINFAMGFALAAWNTASPDMVRYARGVSLALWVLAALGSLWTLSRPMPPKTES